MHVIGGVVFLAICILSAQAKPNLPIDHVDNSAYELLLMQQLPFGLIERRSFTPAEAACMNAYNSRCQEIKDKMTNQTNVCFENANLTSSDNIKNSNVTTAEIRADLITVQTQLANCTNITDTALFLNCVTASNDKNNELLERANSKALHLTAQMKMDQMEIEFKRATCVDAAVGQTKHNQTNALDDYNKCLRAIPIHSLEETADLQAELPVNVLPAASAIGDQNPIRPAIASAAHDETPIRPAIESEDKNTVELNAV